MVMTMEMLVAMGMRMLVVVSMGMLMGMGMSIVAVLMGMTTANVIVIDMHSKSSLVSFVCIHIIAIPRCNVKTFILGKISPYRACEKGRKQV